MSRNYKFHNPLWVYFGCLAKAAQASSDVKNDQFRRHTNKPTELWSNKVILEKIRYIHQTSVEEGLVFYPEDYLYSSTLDYAGKKRDT